MDDIVDANRDNIRDLLASLKDGSMISYLQGVTEKINSLKEKAEEVRNAPIMGKKIAEYEYYTEIQKEFACIYSGVSAFDVLPAFGFNNQEIADLDKIKSEPPEQRKESAIKILAKMGIDTSKINFNDQTDISTNVLDQIGNKMLSDASLFDKARGDIYFKEISDILKTIEEYAAVLTDLNKIDTSKPIERLVAKSLYEKAYENNKKILINAYETLTHEKVKLNDPDPEKGFKLVRDYVTKNYPELIVSMKNQPRVDVAHSKYSNVDVFTSEQLFQMATRNFVTSVIGLVAKTDNLATTFESQVQMLKSVDTPTMSPGTI